MSTFAGTYIKEPADLSVVCTEADIIACADDPGGVDLRNIQTFADLTTAGAPSVAAVVNVMNPLIATAEKVIERYASRAGYAIPLSPIDGEITALVARRLWIDMRQRAKSLTAQAAEDARSKFRQGELADLVAGTLLLNAARVANGTPASGSQVYRISDAASRDADGLTPRLSRKTMESW